MPGRSTSPANKGRLAALGLALTASACTSVAPVPPLAGSRWMVAAIAGEPTGGGSNFFVEFDRGGFGGRFGCNSFRGDARIVRDRLIPGAVSSTEMACANALDGGPDPMRFESNGFRIVARPMQLDWRDPDHLVLRNEAGTIDLRRESGMKR